MIDEDLTTIEEHEMDVSPTDSGAAQPVNSPTVTDSTPSTNVTTVTSNGEESETMATTSLSTVVSDEPPVMPAPNIKGVDAFRDKMEQVKIGILAEASAQDEQFTATVKNNLKKAAIRHTEVEVDKAEYQSQQVRYASELLDTKEKSNENTQLENKWTNREKRREFHYNGVSPIMKFVGINAPMNLFLLYLLTLILTPFFLLAKLWKGTIGALIAGAEDSDRSKAAKGFIWTVLALFVLCVFSELVYLFLTWQNII